MSKGYLVSADSTVVLTTSYQAIALGPVQSIAMAQRTPGAPHIWAVEFDFTQVGSATSIQVALSYDSGGVAALTGPSDAASIANVTGTRGVAAIRMDAPAVSWPAGTRGTIYAWVKVNDGTGSPTLAARGVRAVYTDSAGE